jgi:hypothetical protein
MISASQSPIAMTNTSSPAGLSDILAKNDNARKIQLLEGRINGNGNSSSTGKAVAANPFLEDRFNNNENQLNINPLPSFSATDSTIEDGLPSPSTPSSASEMFPQQNVPHPFEVSHQNFIRIDNNHNSREVVDLMNSTSNESRSNHSRSNHSPPRLTGGKRPRSSLGTSLTTTDDNSFGDNSFERARSPKLREENDNSPLQNGNSLSSFFFFILTPSVLVL